MRALEQAIRILTLLNKTQWNEEAIERFIKRLPLIIELESTRDREPVPAANAVSVAVAPGSVGSIQLRIFASRKTVMIERRDDGVLRATASFIQDELNSEWRPILGIGDARSAGFRTDRALALIIHAAAHGVYNASRSEGDKPSRATVQSLKNYCSWSERGHGDNGAAVNKWGSPHRHPNGIIRSRAGNPKVKGSMTSFWFLPNVTCTFDDRCPLKSEGMDPDQAALAWMKQYIPWYVRT